MVVFSVSVSTSPSVSSNLCGGSRSELTSLLHQSGFRSSEELDRSRSRSRSVNPSLVWSSVDGSSALALSSPDTLSLTLSDADTGNGAVTMMDPSGVSPDHLVNRRAVLERIGMGGHNTAEMDQSFSSSHHRSQASSR